MSADLTWHDRAFAELSLAELHAILALRAAVFVVEQRCAYQDVDGLDPTARHVFATHAPTGALAAYLRILPGDGPDHPPRIGRVVVARAHRGTGLGRELVRRGLAAAGADRTPIRIAAQQHLTAFYAQLGFTSEDDPFDEDGIPHVHMLRAPAPHA